MTAAGHRAMTGQNSLTEVADPRHDPVRALEQEQGTASDASSGLAAARQSLDRLTSRGWHERRYRNSKELPRGLGARYGLDMPSLSPERPHSRASPD